MRNALAVAAVGLACACSAQGGVRVTVDEYSLSARPDEERAGDVTFTVQNIGSIAHQFQILKTELAPDELPVEKGVVVLEDDDIEVVEQIAIIARDDTETASARLEAGPHVLICNIAGHYDNGMRAGFDVVD